ncbi:MAG: acyltransferase [Lachnospiraceae bacterium]|nr:acyltransferase [Lachnospiraceae bacterium]
MHLTYVIYILCLLLILCGGKCAGRGRFHEDYLSNDVIKYVRGIAAVGVIVHHISLEELFKQTGELTVFQDAGYLFVALFFFSSGYGLLKNLDTNKDYLNGFLRRRLPVVLVPYYVSVLFYAIYIIAVNEHLEPLQWVTNIIGITMMNVDAWYPIVLAILYAAFYLIFKRDGSRIRKFVYIYLIILAMGIFFCLEGHFLWWAGSEPNWWMNPDNPETELWYMQDKVFWFTGEWWVNSQIAFLFGMIYETYEEKISGFFRKNYAVKNVLLFVVTAFWLYVTNIFLKDPGYWSEFAGNGPAIGAKFLLYFMQQPATILFTLYIVVFMMKYRAINPVARFFGKYSLETYMMNRLVILILTPILLELPGRIIKDERIAMPVYIICVFAATILMALVFRKVSDAVKKALGFVH